MSDLQIGLIILGLALILAVVLFNAWQDWRARTRMRRQFARAHDDALLGDTRREPMLGTVAQALDEDDEVDARCEAVIDISFPHPVDADALLAALQALIRAADKPVRLFAQNEDAQRVRLPQGEPCSSLQLAVLLANRSGALNRIAWSAIWTQAQALAAQFDGAIEGPEQDQVVAEAAALDALCASLDATVNLCVKLAAPLPLAEVQRAAHEVGFTSHEAHWVWVGAHGAPRFTLLPEGAASQPTPQHVQRLDLILDVPNSPPDAQAFSYMARIGRNLAQHLHAMLLDDQGKPLAADADAVIDQQLQDITRRLIEAGFAPGSARCARVFA